MMKHVRGAPFHLQTQGKIERCHQTIENRVLLENYHLLGDLQHQIGALVDYYTNQRYHESLNNVTPADVYFGRDNAILREREKNKKRTIRQRRLQHQKQAAKSNSHTNQSLQCSSRSDVPFYMTKDTLFDIEVHRLQPTPDNPTYFFRVGGRTSRKSKSTGGLSFFWRT